jgi:1-deoxy-D-xylulose-5-phosphate reductoisomerase
VDSEHNAIFQVLGSGDASEADLVTITASGGPFREWSLERMRAATVEEAVAHPNWAMGRKISLDSATLMNKGLELIEACLLFALPLAQVEVVVHPQSIVHSLVEYVDGSMLAQLGNPDMRTAIAYALAWPERVEAGVAALDLFKIARLDFQAPDLTTFRCLDLAYRALTAGGTATTILNAANEEAVAAFLDRRLPFLAIAETIERCLDTLASIPATDLATVLDADLTARRTAQRMIASFSGSTPIHAS